MKVIYLTEYKTRCYGVTFQNKRSTEVQNFKDIPNHENNKLCVKPLKTFLGKSEVCDMIMVIIIISLANDNLYRYISKMGNNLNLYSIAIGEENIYFLTPHFKFFKREKIDDNELLKTLKDNVLIHLIIMFQIVENTPLKIY